MYFGNYNHTCIYVCVDGSLSEALPINSDILQGSVISPTLLLLFINDFLLSTSNPIHAFADASTLHSTSTYSSPKASTQSLTTDRASTINSINTDLDSILSWGSDDLVASNHSNTKCLVFPTSSSCLSRCSNVRYAFASFQVPMYVRG